LAGRIVSGVRAVPACTALHALMTSIQPPASATSNAALLREVPLHNRSFSPPSHPPAPCKPCDERYPAGNRRTGPYPQRAPAKPCGVHNRRVLLAIAGAFSLGTTRGNLPDQPPRANSAIWRSTASWRRRTWTWHSFAVPATCVVRGKASKGKRKCTQIRRMHADRALNRRWLTSDPPAMRARHVIAVHPGLSACICVATFCCLSKGKIDAEEPS